MYYIIPRPKDLGHVMVCVCVYNIIRHIFKRKIINPRAERRTTIIIIVIITRVLWVYILTGRGKKIKTSIPTHVRPKCAVAVSILCVLKYFCIIMHKSIDNYIYIYNNRCIILHGMQSICRKGVRRFQKYCYFVRR